ncbi:MAG: tyrosine-type recombinase/integrase [Alphaproteobacteria bacterium]
MARQVRDVSLETRNARRAAKVRAKPYWRALDRGLHLGYRKRATGGSWIVRRFTEAGRYSESKLGLADDIQDADGVKTLNYRQAQQAARDWYHAEIRIERGLDPASTGPYTVANAMRDYLAHYRVEGKAVVATESAVNSHILPELGEIELDRLSTKRIADWHKALATSPARLRTGKAAGKRNSRKLATDAESIRPRRATANRVLNILKAALNYAWKEGRVASDTAWRKVKPFKNVEAPVIRYLTEAECVRLANACPQDFRTMVQAAMFTGCRYGELVKLKAADYNPDAGTVAVRTSKSGKPRHVVLTDEGRALFARAVTGKNGAELIFTHNGNAWGKSHQSRPLMLACKQAQIVPAISFHVLRHTHGSLLAMQGVPMPVIAKQLGHADTRMTEKHYAHLSPSYVADTIRQHFPTLGMLSASNVATLGRRK